MTRISISVQKVFLPFIHHSASKGFSAQITGTASDVVKQRQKENITKTLRKTNTLSRRKGGQELC